MSCTYLALNDIEHRKTRVRRTQTNSFDEHFNRMVLDEFLSGIKFREKFYEGLDELQRDLDAWLDYYNTERPHRGYRNTGKRPIETITNHIPELEPEPKSTVRKIAKCTCYYLCCYGNRFGSRF